MNHDFTKKLGEWLNQSQPEKDFELGAVMLLQLSGNKIRYAMMSGKAAKYKDSIQHELQKYYDFRVTGLTHSQVMGMQREVDRIAVAFAQEPGKDSGASHTVDAKKTGRREDHDSLPDDIKALYVENLSLLQKERELHLKLRSLSLDDSPCSDNDRFPFVAEIIKLDKRRLSNWKTYDSYNPDSEPK